MKRSPVVAAIAVAVVVAIATAAIFVCLKKTEGESALTSPDYLRATYNLLHTKPTLDSATDDQCLACHREVLSDRVRVASPAGLKSTDTLAWYQRAGTYVGEQETFHRRHLATPLATKLMKLTCTTCHQGHDPRDEAPGSSATAPPQASTDFTLRKQVNVERTCLKCHGQMPYPIMGLPSAWPESREMFGKSCLTCHSAIRTNRHQVTYLNADAIEKAGQESDEVCYGCHGGRAWYRISYPYPRHAWDGMPADIPDWAKDRPTTSEARFVPPATGKVGK